MNDVVHGDRTSSGGHWQEEQLTAYLLGELSDAEMEALDAHLRACATCRATLERLEEAFVGSVDRLDEPPPLRDAVWQGIEERTSARKGASEAAPPPLPASRNAFALGAWAVAVTLLVAVGSWGTWQRQQLQQVRAEAATLEARIEVLEGVVGTVQASADALFDDRARIARWLADDTVRTARLAAADDGRPVGSVLFEPTGRALVVMRELPEEGRDFQAWGILDGQVTSLGAFEGLTLEVDASSYEAVAVSLEPDGGSAAPTNVLGSAGRG